MPATHPSQKAVFPAFYVKVWDAMERIPRGKVTTYKELARAIGNPNASRAIGNACNKNPNAPHTPCHRVVASDGSLGGYAFGLRKKVRLLESEGVQLVNNRIDLEKFGFTFPRR
ncbi:MAG: MGMT family protein [Candidatus Iainarchaeum archaeon]|uniref:methylated-DNA--[protein]-cysteine S-methyltransferase n=1 Tax=Candidatus Iainarchaeum sp. TaxID=3101447 RepID=A0A7T9DJB1_9ARCH|nr:MAG: MGMT family protein [Candidatus Diapherotrites archaeon]